MDCSPFKDIIAFQFMNYCKELANANILNNYNSPMFLRGNSLYELMPLPHVKGHKKG
jgi:hypothetical protein